MKITFHGRIPSKKNSTRRIKRGNRVFTVPSAAHEAWEAEQLYTLPKIDKPILKCAIIAYFYMPDARRADMHNKFESIADVLVKKGILADDSWQVMCYGQANIPMGIDKKNPRVIVEIVERKYTPFESEKVDFALIKAVKEYEDNKPKLLIKTNGQ